MKKTKLFQRNHVLFLFTLPIVIMYCIFFIVPLLMGMKNSFTDWSGTSPEYNFIGIQNYVDIFQDERFRNALVFNFKYTILLTIGTVVISLIIALILNQKLKGRTFLRSIYFLPAILSLVTVGLIWNELFLQSYSSDRGVYWIRNLQLKLAWRSQACNVCYPDCKSLAGMRHSDCPFDRRTAECSSGTV